MGVVVVVSVGVVRVVVGTPAFVVVVVVVGAPPVVVGVLAATVGALVDAVLGARDAALLVAPVVEESVVGPSLEAAEEVAVGVPDAGTVLVVGRWLEAAATLVDAGAAEADVT